jgi:hypothetical protein
MIKDKKVWEEFENELVKSERPDFEQNLKIFEMMLEHARAMKVFPLKNPLEGIETKIKMVKIIHSLR